MTAAAFVTIGLTAVRIVAAQSAEELIASKHVMIRASVEPAVVLVGQPAELKIEVMTRTWFLAAPRYPEVIGVDDAVVLPPGSFGVNSSERIGGDTYAVQARTFMVFPMAPGQVEVPSIEVVLVVAREDASRSPEIMMRTSAMELQAKVPESARGRGLVIAAPSLEVEQKWSRSFDGMKVGDALTRTVTQRVERSVAMVLAAPHLEAVEGIASYRKRPILETETGRGALSGTRTDEVTYVLESEGEIELPGEEILWWDLKGDRLRVEKLPGAVLTVAADPELAAEHLAAPVDVIAEEDAGVEGDRSSWWRIGLAALVAALLLMAAAPRVRRLLTRRVGLLYRKPDPERAAFRKLRSAVRSKDPGSTLTALYRWRDAVPGIPGPPTLEALVAMADDPILERELAILLEAAEGGHGDWMPGEMLTALDRLRRRLTTAMRGRPVGNSGLSPLNPRS